MVDMIIKNGRIVTSDGIILGGIAIEEGRIVAIASDQYLPKGIHTIDVGGKYLIPGIVDPETHTGTRFAFKQDIQSESCAALAGGVTTWGIQLTSRLLDPQLAAKEDAPLFSKTFPAFQKAGDEYCRTDYFFVPIFVTEAQVLEIPKLAEQFGITSFKYYLHLQSRRIIENWRPAGWYGFKESSDDSLVYLGLELTAQIGPPGIVCFHPENQEISRIFAERLQKSGRKDLAAWNEKTPHFCEAGHIRTWAYYAKAANCPIYFVHVTTEESIKEILQARTDGLRIFGETGTEYLFFDYNVWKKVPTLRDRQTIEKLWRALSNGTTNCTGTDHVNIGETKEEMTGEDVWSMKSGYPSRVEAHLPVLLSEGVNKGRISLSRLIQVACENPAKIFGLFPKKGTIRIGSDADLVVIDLNLTRKVTNDQILSSSGWTMWEGREMKGWPVMVILRGDVVMEWPEGEVRPRIIGPPKGKYLPRILDHQFYPLVQ